MSISTTPLLSSQQFENNGGSPLVTFHTVHHSTSKYPEEKKEGDVENTVASVGGRRFKETKLKFPDAQLSPKNKRWLEQKNEKIIKVDAGCPNNCSLFQNILKLIPDGHPFKTCLEIAGQKLCNIREISFQNITIPYGYTPNKAALLEIAASYYEKYKVLIHVTTYWDLKNLLTNIESQVDSNEGDGPHFIGINISFDDEFTHALPLICFMGKINEETAIRKVEFLIADTIKYHDLINRVRRTLQDYAGCVDCDVLRDCYVYSTLNGRQVDTFSCKLAGMLFLKRALLELQGSSVDCLSDYLKLNAKLSTENEYKVEHLPPTFDASDQISNKIIDGTIIDSRSLHSKNPKKHPITVEELRKKYKTNIDVKYVFTVQDLNMKDVNDLPENVTVQLDQNPLESRSSYQVTVYTSIKINGQLANKGKFLSQKIGKIIVRP